MRTKCCKFIVSNWYRTGIELVSNWYRTGIELMYRAGLEMGGGCRTRGRVFHKPSGPEIGTVFRGELLYTSQTLRRDCVTFGLLQTTCPGIRSFFGGGSTRNIRATSHWERRVFGLRRRRKQFETALTSLPVVIKILHLCNYQRVGEHCRLNSPDPPDLILTR